jgi:hypothetical protein
VHIARSEIDGCQKVATLKEDSSNIRNGEIRIKEKGRVTMKEPGLDRRHRDKSGEIQQKRSDTLNKNLPHPIPQFSANATLGHMRKVTGKVSETAVRRAAAKTRK